MPEPNDRTVLARLMRRGGLQAEPTRVDRTVECNDDFLYKERICSIIQNLPFKSMPFPSNDAQKSLSDSGEQMISFVFFQGLGRGAFKKLIISDIYFASA